MIETPATDSSEGEQKQSPRLTPHQLAERKRAGAERRKVERERRRDAGEILPVGVAVADGSPDEVWGNRSLFDWPLFPVSHARRKAVGTIYHFQGSTVIDGVTTPIEFKVEAPHLVPSDVLPWWAIISKVSDGGLPNGRYVTFSGLELHQRMGKNGRPGKFDYVDMKDSTRRLAGVSITSTNALSVKQKNEAGETRTEYLQTTFHLVDEVSTNFTVYEHDDGTKSEVVTRVVFKLSGWMAKLLTSMGHIPINRLMWLAVDNYLGKRMLEYLNSRLYGLVVKGAPELAQEYEKFCKHLGTEPRPYLSDARRSFQQAFAGLIDTGLVAGVRWEWAPTRKYLYFTPGPYFTGVRTPAAKLPKARPAASVENKPPAKQGSGGDSIIQEIQLRGVHVEQAKQLAAAFPADVIRQHLHVHDQELKHEGVEKFSNPAGRLHSRIAENWQPFPGYKPPEETARLEKRKRAEADKRDAAEREHRAEQEHRRTWWQSETPEQHAECVKEVAIAAWRNRHGFREPAADERQGIVAELVAELRAEAAGQGRVTAQ